MTSKWHQKKAKQAEIEFERNLLNQPEYETMVKDPLRAVANGQGDEELFEKKLSKEEKKARAKAAREAKKKGKGDGDDDQPPAAAEEKFVVKTDLEDLATNNSVFDDGIDHEQTDKLAAAGTVCTFASSRKGVDDRSRDINVQNFTLQHMGAVLLDESEVILNHGNRYGLIGRNGCGKSTLLKALGARAVPIPRGIDIFFLSEEVEPSDTMTAIDAVMSVDAERLKLEQRAEYLNQLMAHLAEHPDEVGEGEKTAEEQQDEIMESLSQIYERLDALDASTAEVRARSILRGLGFTHEMQGKLTKDFSGGWRMRVSLARALFIQPICLLLDEPTNHLDMEAVIWLEDYLAKWDKILLLVSHSQDFLNNVCTHMIHFNNKKKLQYYDGNYDQFIKTKGEKEENQWKQYKWEQEQIKSMKDYIARFGHGTAKNARQAQSKEKVLEKMVRAGLTEKPEEEKPLNFRFTDPGKLPPPVLAFHDVSFGYPKCQPLYSNVSFGVDLDSRVALVGPNGAGKTTLIKLMAGELQPTMGDIRPHGHLKLGRFTQHFVDVLDLEMTPLEFFEQHYPNDPRDEQRKYLGRFGISGTMQVQKMKELSDGQKSRVVFAKMGREVPHILLLDEPTNHLDMESIDALASAVNEFEGGLVLVSHDMRLISQVAKEIWICDNKKIEKYGGDILSFKMDMRHQMGLMADQKPKLRGDASVQQKPTDVNTTKAAPAFKPKPAASKLEIVNPKKASSSGALRDMDDDATATTFNSNTTSSSFDTNGLRKVLPPTSVPTSVAANGNGNSSYVPPHLRKKLQQQQTM